VAELIPQLKAFAVDNHVKGKGPLSVMLVVTRHAKERGLPLRADDLLTEKGGQVLGLGKSAAQAILAEYGITRVLAEEGGRTSRGSIDHMRRYVDFLNRLHADGLADLDNIEAWWILCVNAHFASKPLALRLDPSKSLRAIVRDLLDQALKRQQESQGTMYGGAVLQHLVGAKLETWRPGGVEHHGFSVKDEASGRPADFLIGEAAIHVTMSPSEALMQKCLHNLEAGLRPLIVTSLKGVLAAEGFAELVGIQGRVDIFEVEQFVATNLHERSGFAVAQRRTTVEQFINAYNDIVSAHETDPSLQIKIGS
jgi:hypothetical protein